MPNEIYAAFDTTEGSFKIKLFADKAPLTVQNFVSLAEGTKTGNSRSTMAPSSTRVIPDFMIQGGDPEGTGTRRPRLQIRRRVSSGPQTFQARCALHGQLGPGTNGSQFFVTVAATPGSTTSTAFSAK